MYKVECLYVSEYVCLFPVNSAALWSTPHVIDILNQHNPGSALVYSSFALTEYSEVSSSRSVRHSIKADEQRKLKLKISNT